MSEIPSYTQNIFIQLSVVRIHSFLSRVPESCAASSCSDTGGTEHHGHPWRQLVVWSVMGDMLRWSRSIYSLHHIIISSYTSTIRQYIISSTTVSTVLETLDYCKMMHKEKVSEIISISFYVINYEKIEYHKVCH